MFIDLAKDWRSGSLTEIVLFVLLIYMIKLGMLNCTINLYVNDHNILGRPLVKEVNGELYLPQILRRA